MNFWERAADPNPPIRQLVESQFATELNDDSVVEVFRHVFDEGTAWDWGYISNDERYFAYYRDSVPVEVSRDSIDIVGGSECEVCHLYPWRVFFLSNHSDMEWIDSRFDEPVQYMPFPHVEPEWSEKEVGERCADVIERAVAAETLVMNGEDCFLVGTILKARLDSGKRTGFITIRELNEPRIRWV